ncbi:lamin tail domain-containing protein [Chitinibacter bivalviorum]|uniref:Lamin tail domain-containing protein n=1 Tax=Chitinibacter bivalviorum TaxID=2739434 RepID=A0A7H9BMA4_9NEIS|nr:zinc-dependent metalloprotease family protein [Chitinibacter bivalviorum]QLG89221.1 lamin tail domain-containing protein [Chitinibacter bivalviorum]
MNKSSLFLATLATTALLSACGGGGGGSSTSITTPAPTMPSITPQPADPISTTPIIPAPVAIPMAAGALRISEISSSGWIEIYNPNTDPVDVSRVKLRTYDNASRIIEFDIPAATILPKGYLVVAKKPTASAVSSQQVVFVGNLSQYPDFWSSGFVELITDTQSIDFVRYGSDSTASKFAAQSPAPWSGSAAPALASASYGNSLVRPASSINSDTNTNADWSTSNFSTPFGANDVPANAVDADNDGIPDSAEIAGGTFAGLDLYGMGARTGQRDIFVEIDYMSSTDVGVKPRPEALKKIVDVFARQGIALHFDAGPNVPEYNLGNAQSVLPFNRCLDLGYPAFGCADVYDLKTKYFDLRRNPIFHYAVMGYESGSSSGAAGLGEVSGNDFNITLGNQGYSVQSVQQKQFLINIQAATIMHELGHNLGLRHGGFEDHNYKPNYISTMNYTYANAGLPLNAAGANAGQRWYLQNGLRGLSICSSALEANACSDSFIIDYSNGVSQDLDEVRLSESNLLGRGTSSGAYIDWNADNRLTATLLSLNIDSPDSSVSLDVLRDYNDWANLVLPFARQYQGSMLRSVNDQRPVHEVHFLNDKQPVAKEWPILRKMP